MWKAAINCIIKTIRHRKDRSVNHFRPNFTAIKYYEENFKMLHRKLKKSGKLDDEKLYNKIILLNSIENLCTWASHVQSVIEKEAKVPEKKAPSKFKFWGKKIEETEELPQPETYDKVFSEISANPLPENSLLPKSYIKVKFELSLGSGIFKLVKNSYTGEDFLIFSYTQLYSCLCIKVQGLDLNLSMKDLSLSSYSERAFTKIIEKLSAEEKLWEFNFKAKPNDEVSWSLDSVFQSLEINYNPAFLALLLSFFVVPKTHDSTKNAAWDTIKGIQDTTSEALNDLLHGETIYSLSVLCYAPKIKIPSPTHQGYFLVNLGNILVTNKSSVDRYEDFNICISSLGLKYEQNSNKEVIDVVPEFEIASLVKILKSKYKPGKKPETPAMIIESNLPILNVIFNSSIYYQLQRLPEMFKYDQIDENQENVQTETKIQGKVRKLAIGMHAWKEFNAALKGSYLYFYSQEHLEGVPSSFFYIKDCSFQDISKEYETDNCIQLQNSYGECIFAVDSKDDFEKWKKILCEAINEFENRTSVASSKLTSRFQNVLYQFIFQAPNTVISLTTENSALSAIINLKNLKSEIIAKDCEYEFKGTLGGMEIVENVESRFSKLIQSKESQDMISVYLKYVDSKSPNYKNEDISIELKCGFLEINWNYHPITQLLNFFQFAEYSDPTLIIRESVGTISKNHVLLNFWIQTDDINIYLNNTNSQISLAVVSVQKFDTRLLMKTEGILIKGTLGNIEISDLTNYPATALGLEPTPYKLFTVRENNSLLGFDIILYSDQYEERDQDMSTKVELELSSVNFVYLQQPVLRMIDFFNYHILGAFDTQSRAKQIDEKSVIKPKFSEEKLRFTSISVKINHPIVKIPPRPGYPTYLVWNLGIITVKNRLEKENNPGWVDIFDIQMKNLKILSTDKEITDGFDVSLQVKRKLLLSTHPPCF